MLGARFLEADYTQATGAAGMTEATPGDEFVPYLILVRLAKGDSGDLKVRVQETLPVLTEALQELGDLHQALVSYDGSLAVYLLAARADVAAGRVIEQLQSPRSGRGSPLETRDQLLVTSIDAGLTHRLERVEDWLRNFHLLTW